MTAGEERTIQALLRAGLNAKAIAFTLSLR
jgi:hypothetical protein